MLRIRGFFRVSKTSLSSTSGFDVSGAKNRVEFRFRPFRNNYAGDVSYYRLPDDGEVVGPSSNYELSS